MARPSKVYVATTALGVYYTSNFHDANPAWATRNTDLPATDCRHFAVDPFDDEGRQYVLLEASRILYRREGAGWVEILTPADAATLTGASGCKPSRIYCDTSVDGRIWVTCFSATTLELWPIYSSDYGDTWTAAAKIPYWVMASAQGIMSVRAYGDDVFVLFYLDTGWGIARSTNLGASWSGSGVAVAPDSLAMNPLLPDRVYYDHDAPGGAGTLKSLTIGGAETVLQTLFHMPREDAMWFSEDSAAYQRLLDDGRLAVTDDSWATVNTVTPSLYPICFAPWAGADEDQMIVGLGLYSGVEPPAHQHHIIGVLYGDTDITTIGLAGTNCGTPPYTDAIPATCGGIAWGGIVALKYVPTEGPTPGPGETITPPGGTPISLGGTANVQAVTMPGYLGYDMGEPMPSDRGAFRTDTEAHASLHAEDIRRNIDDGDSTLYHLPTDAAVGEVPMWDGIGYAPEDVLTPAEHTAIGNNAPHHAPVTLGAGSDAALGLAGQELTLADVLTPAEHTAIGNGAPHHAPVTLGAGDAALSLIGQQLTLADVLTPAEHTAIGDGAPHHAALTLGANPGLSLSTQELVLGTPSTLTVSTTNAVTGANHTHAITSDSNPGATAKILATDGSGFVTVVRLATDGVPAGSIASISASGFAEVHAHLDILPLSPTADCQIEIGTTRSGNGNSYIDLTGDATYTDFGARLLRFAGANGATGFYHRGTGTLSFIAYEAAPIAFGTTSAERMRITAAGLVSVGAYPANTRLAVEIPDSAQGTIDPLITGQVATTTVVGMYCSRDLGAPAGWGLAFNVWTANVGPIEAVRILQNGKVGRGVTAPTAGLHLAAGSATQYTAPLKFTSGTSLTTAEAGAMEFTTDDLFFTITTGAARKGIVLDDGTRLTATRVPFATTNGRLVDDADLTFATDTLSATKVAASGGVTTQAVDFTASTPDALAGDVNNWDLGNNTFIRASGGAADRIVTGIVARASGHLLIFQNIGTTNKITFANESASSTAANRLINANAGSTEITPNHCIMYIYDATTARWREITHL